MNYFLGIDGGGTKTDCVAGDATSVLGRSQAGSCKIQRVGRQQAEESLRSAVMQACANAPGAEIEAACIGIAGASDPAVCAWARGILSSLVKGSIAVVGDHVIAHQAAFAGAPGLLVIAGTGSIVYGRNSQGETARAGGHGPIVSDEGSGDWVGRRAVEAFFFQQNLVERGKGKIIETESLSAEIGRTLHLTKESDATSFANSTPDYSSLFPIVLRSANAGDETAGSILQAAGKELANLAMEAMQELWLADEKVHILFTGGVALNSALVRSSFEEAVSASKGDITVGVSQHEPVMGALALARALR